MEVQVMRTKEKTAKQLAVEERKAKREDLKKQIAAMEKDRDATMEASKKQLLEQLDVNSKKYLTVNGYMDARSILEVAYIGNYAEDAPEALRDNARDLAEYASQLLAAWRIKVEEADTEDYPTLLDDQYDADFISSGFGEVETARQLVIVSALQNVGPSLDEAYGFYKAAQEGIAKMTEALKAV